MYVLYALLSDFNDLYTAINMHAMYILMIFNLYVDMESLYSFSLFYSSSLEREEAEDLIKRHGGRVTGSVSKKTVITVIIQSYYCFIVGLFCSYLISCRIIYYVTKILVDGSLPRPRSLGKFLIFILYFWL